MTTWFEGKVKYSKIDERSDKDVTSIEIYLVDAVSFTECESRLTEQMKEIVSGDFSIVAEKITKIEEIHAYEADGIWYKCKIAFIDADEKSGKEKQTVSEILINADSMKQARDRTEEVLKGVIIPYTIKGINETKIIDIFPYFNESEND